MKLSKGAIKRLDALEARLRALCPECYEIRELCPYCCTIYNKALAGEEGDELFAQSPQNS